MGSGRDVPSHPENSVGLRQEGRSPLVSPLAVFQTLGPYTSSREAWLERELAESRALLADMTRRLHEETQRLTDARRQVAHSDKLRLMGQFVGGVVHDINNVLAVMQATTLLLTRKAPGDASGKLADQASRSVERGRQLVRQLLDFARPDGDGAEVFSPLTALRDDCELLAHLAGPTVRLAIEGDEDGWRVLAEPARLQTVLFNLVANARDACGERGEATLSVRNIRASQRPAGLPRRDYICIAVADNGPGMPPHVLARAGEPFFTTKGAGQGTGLGLASAFELAERCQGRVVIDSPPGGGARIALYLPRASVEAADAGVAPVDAARHGDATLLVVETEGMALRHISSSLRSLGYTVIEAANPQTALADALGEIPLDLVIADLDLGSGRGAKLAERLRRDRPDLPVIFVTGSPAMGVPRGELVFRKPVNEAALAHAVLERLGRAPASALTAAAIRRTDRIGARIRHPGVRAIYEAWRARAGDLGRLPSPDDARVILRRQPDDAYLLAVEDDEDAPVFRFLEVGAALVRRLGRPLVGETVGAGDEDALGAMTAAYKRCLDGVPYFDYARFRLGDGQTLLFERLLTPLTDDGERVSHLMGVATFEDIDEPKGGTGGDGGF